MKLHRLLALALCGCLLMSGCQKADDDTPSPDSPAPSGPSASPDETHTRAALCYSAADTLDPYQAQTRVNRELTPLLYEGLTNAEKDWTVTNELAASVEQTDPTHLQVTLRQDAKFSDGSAVTPADIIASLKLAKASGAYEELVANIRSIDKKLLVTLATADTVNPQAALSFPSVRREKTAVLGTGLYMSDTETDALIANPHHPVKPTTTRWELADITERKDMRYALSAGNIALYTTDLTDSQTPAISGDVRQETVTLNHLIYLGVSAKQPYAAAEFRAGLSAALDRTTLCSNGFAGYATPATTPFIPTWKPSAALSGASVSENIEQTIEKWKVLGYNNLDNGSTSAGQKELPQPELLVCKDNAFHVSAANLIADQLGRAGLTVTVKAEKESDYRARVQSGRFDLYLGEIRLANDNNLRPWLTAYGIASAGVPTEAKTAYSAYRAGETSLADFNLAFTESWPFIPLAWRVGAVICASSLQGLSLSGSDFYNGIQHLVL